MQILQVETVKVIYEFIEVGIVLSQLSEVGRFPAET